MADLRTAAQQALEDLTGVLCDPDGRCCIDGSSEDRAIVDRALSKIRAALAEQEQGRKKRKPKNSTTPLGIVCFEAYARSKVGSNRWDIAAEAVRAALAEPVAKLHPFVVKHYISDDLPTIKGNGFDFGVCLGREEAERFVAWVNARITTLPTRQPLTPAQEHAEELLEVLTELANSLPSAEYMRQQGQEEGPLLRKMRAAIAKATGSNDE